MFIAKLLNVIIHYYSRFMSCQGRQCYHAKVDTILWIDVYHVYMYVCIVNV